MATPEEIGQELVKHGIAAVVAGVTALFVSGKSLLKRHKEHGETIAKHTQSLGDVDVKLVALGQAVATITANVDAKVAALRKDVDSDLDVFDEKLKKHCEKIDVDVRALHDKIHGVRESSHDLADRAEVARVMTEVTERCLEIAKDTAELRGMVEMMVSVRKR